MATCDYQLVYQTAQTDLLIRRMRERAQSGMTINFPVTACLFFISFGQYRSISERGHGTSKCFTSHFFIPLQAKKSLRNTSNSIKDKYIHISWHSLGTVIKAKGIQEYEKCNTKVFPSASHSCCFLPRGGVTLLARPTKYKTKKAKSLQQRLMDVVELC